MKLEELRKVIREEVQNAFKAELRDVLIEAVAIASTPTNTTTENRQSSFAATTTESVKTQAFKPAPKAFKPTGNPIEDMLQMTAANMTGAEAKNFMGEGVHAPNLASSVASQMGLTGAQPGIDLSQLPFVNKAKAVLEAANQKDKQRQGLA